jgi:hypothetical protein
MAKILSDTMQGEIDVKRFYMSGVQVEDVCPKCGDTLTYDGEEQYVSNPTAGSEIDLHMYCEDCDHEWDIKVQLQVKISF